MGETGASVGARVLVSDGTTSSELVPKITFGELGASDSQPSPLSENMELALVSLNAEDLSATLRVQLTTPIYPIEVFHKPMTILVWIGTALMTVSGVASAIYRKTSVLVEEEEPAPIAPSAQKSAGIPTNEIGGTS
jgi:cytochrome c-type biogenesis protein CcmF